MSNPRPRSLSGFVGLVAVLAQLVVAHEVVFAGTLPLISLIHGHGHPVTLLAHEGHVDVVLHHESDSPAPTAVLELERVHGGDHVLHVTGAEISAKHGQDRAAAAAVALTRGHPPAVAPAAVAYTLRTSGRGVRSPADGLRTTVLRL
ncbi:MAG: hypothetical protein HKP30_18170 [Myxococcales bacterium]|nr:hypothetical protein [Myxococcales bacterium]